MSRPETKKAGYMIAGKMRIDVGTTTRRQLDERCCASPRGTWYGFGRGGAVAPGECYRRNTELKWCYEGITMK